MICKKKQKRQIIAELKSLEINSIDELNEAIKKEHLDLSIMVGEFLQKQRDEEK